MSYLGRTGKLSQRAYNKLSFLATAGQTVKAGLSYVAGFVEVYVNGTLLTDVVDYSASNGNSVTFLVALSVDDEVTVVSLKTFSVANMLPLSGGTLSGDLDVTGSVTADGLTVDGDASINRLSTDGVLLDLKKDGTAVGSIGTLASFPYIGKGDVTLLFSDSDDQIIPRGVGAAQRTGVISLGDASNTFKDLHLSGGVVFGTPSGSASSNTLDDYEEGTWTPATGVSLTENTAATYVKVGSFVMASFDITFGASSDGAEVIVVLPFVGLNYGSGSVGWNSSGGVAGIHLSSAGAYIQRHSVSGSLGFTYSQASGVRFIGTAWYQTNS